MMPARRTWGVRMNGRSVIVVVEKQSLVRLDLVCQAQDAAPEAEVMGFGSAHRAVSELAGGARLAGIVASLPVAELRASGLAALASERDAWIVCVDGSPRREVEAAGWHHLPKPFFAEEAMALFSSLQRERLCEVSLGA